MMADGNVIPLWRAQLQQGERGVKKNLTNLVLYLRNLPGLGTQFRHNELTGTVEWKGRPIEDVDYVDIRLVVESAGYQPDKADIPPSVARIALDNAYNPVRDYLDALTWDNKPRLNKWLHRLMGTSDGAYEASIGSKFLIGAVARVYEPGCKFDHMLVLEGPQGIGKSTALAKLFGAKYFTEFTGDLKDHPRFMAQISGKWIIEFAELAAMRRSDMEMVKAVVTMQADRGRLPYERHAAEHPRRCVLAATVNPQEEAGYLSDPTGNRRFWPAKCTKADMKLIEQNRDQIWAEAVHRYRAGEQWWLGDEEAQWANEEQNQRVAVDPWLDHLVNKIETYQTYTSIQLLGLLGVAPDKQAQSDKIRIAKAMRKLGWKQVEAKDQNRKSIRAWKFDETADGSAE